MTGDNTKKILIVDDEAYIRLLIEQSLEDLQVGELEILHASDGLEALGLLQAERPDLVFLDLMLPGLSGFEVCRIVKQELKLQEIFIVILTAKGQLYDRQQSEAVGADIFMTKSFDPDELLGLATRVLSARSGD